MDERIGSSAVVETIAALSPLIEEVHPFDVYRGEKLGQAKRV
jgi:phenylalanyl-tRNA synthetase beta subunit